MNTKDHDFAEMQLPITQADFAELSGISQKTVSNYIKRGVLARDGSCLEWIRSYADHLRAAAANRIESDDDYKAATLRLKKADADLMELKVSQLEATLVSLSEFYSELETAHDHAAAVLARCTDKLVDTIQSQYNIQVDPRVFHAEMTGALSEVKRAIDENKAKPE